MEVKTKDEFQLLDQEANQPINQWVYQVLRWNILRLHLKPGQPISETEISARMATSRTPVREAFIRLAGDGLLDIRPQRFTVVSPIDLEQGEETRFVRRTLEKTILLEVCAKCSTEGIAELESNLEKQKRQLEEKDFDAMLTADDDFHRIIYRECRKERIWAFIKRLDNSHDRLRTMTLPLVAERILAEHRLIVERIRERRLDGLDMLVDAHLTNTVINTEIFKYPSEYFKQDPAEYVRTRSEQ